MTAARRLSTGAAGLLTFVAAATVLVLEIAAGRLLAPYVGVSLETYTGIIGVILAGIAAGAWAGGRASDAHPPERLLGPTFIGGGIAAAGSLPVVTLTGALDLGGSLTAIVILATLGFFVPAAILSAVAPMIVRATITDVETSGSVVGRLSALATLGAITGTFLTGFVLLGLVPTRLLILGAAAAMVLIGAGLTLRFGRKGGAGVGLVGLVGLLGAGALGLAPPGPCERESRYYCIDTVDDSANARGVTLVLDGLRHAYVDRDDPRHLEFRYIRWFADAAAPVLEASDGDVDVLHVGGGGFSFPRFLAATYERSRHVILELDPEVLTVAQEELAFSPSESLRVVVGDAFGGRSVPWHLTTRELLAEIDRVLRPDGIYVMNVIDRAPLRFARAELATLRSLFPHVGVIAEPAAFTGSGGGNIILIGSRRSLDATDLMERIARRTSGDAAATRVVVDPQEVEAWIAGAPVLTDDFAPVDQLLSR